MKFKQSTPDLAQTKLIHNWNTIAKIVNQKIPSMKLPTLSPGGVCSGLSFTFIYYHQREMGERFFELIGMINAPHAVNTISKSIIDNDNDAGQIINFIHTVKKLWRGAKDSIHSIGSQTEAEEVNLVVSRSDIIDYIIKLEPNEGMEISFLDHSIAVYKSLDNNWIVYDSNNSKKYVFNNIISAGNVIFNSINNLTKPSTIFGNLVKEWEALKLDIGLDNLSEPTLSSPQMITCRRITKNPLVLKKDHCNQFTTFSIITKLNKSSFETRKDKELMLEQLVYKITSEGKPEDLEELLKANKIDLNKSIRENDKKLSRYPLHNAVSDGNIEMVKYLIKSNSVDKNIVEYGQTVLHIATTSENAFVLLECLLESDAVRSINKTWLDTTPLSFAVARGDIESARLLLQKGANSNIPNAYGETPLHNAIIKGDLKLVNLLLTYNADLKLINFNEISTIDADIADVLITNGIKIPEGIQIANTDKEVQENPSMRL